MPAKAWRARNTRAKSPRDELSVALPNLFPDRHIAVRDDLSELEPHSYGGEADPADHSQHSAAKTLFEK